MSKPARRADAQPPTHPTSVALSRLPAAEVDAGTDVFLQVKVRCPDGCDLRARPIRLVTPDAVVVAESELADFADAINETPEFAFKAPDVVGEYLWRLVFLRDEVDGLVHEESSLPIAIKTMPHDTSLAVWGVPSPVVIDHPFRIHVGATCTAGCDLTGREIQVCDESGAGIACGQLGDTVWDGTRALYWTEVDLVAPAREGTTSRSIRFTPAELRLPHDGASARFVFETVKPPQHSVVVKVLQKDAGTPIEGAQVRLGVYFADSDQTGLATVAAAQGTYSLDVLKAGYEMFSGVVDVNGDVSVEARLVAVPPENPDAYWLFDPDKRV